MGQCTHHEGGAGMTASESTPEPTYSTRHGRGQSTCDGQGCTPPGCKSVNCPTAADLVGKPPFRTCVHPRRFILARRVCGRSLAAEGPATWLARVRVH